MRLFVLGPRGLSWFPLSCRSPWASARPLVSFLLAILRTNERKNTRTGLSSLFARPAHTKKRDSQSLQQCALVVAFVYYAPQSDLFFLGLYLCLFFFLSTERDDARRGFVDDAATLAVDLMRAGPFGKKKDAGRAPDRDTGKKRAHNRNIDPCSSQRQRISSHGAAALWRRRRPRRRPGTMPRSSMSSTMWSCPPRHASIRALAVQPSSRWRSR